MKDQIYARHDKFGTFTFPTVLRNFGLNLAHEIN